MSREFAIECFNEMDVADRIAIDAASAMKDAEIDPAFCAVSMLKHGVIEMSKSMNPEQHRIVLEYLEDFLTSTHQLLDKYGV